MTLPELFMQAKNFNEYKCFYKNRTMKITNLYTSIGYGEYLESLSIRQFCLLEKINNNINQVEYNAIRYAKRRSFDDYLKQPLTEEMIFNKGTEPPMKYIVEDREVEYWRLMKEWQESESKVIFEDVIMKEIITSDSKVIERHYYLGNNIIVYNENSDRLWINDLSFKTLHDLAEATNGELKTKNIEL